MKRWIANWWQWLTDKKVRAIVRTDKIRRKTGKQAPIEIEQEAERLLIKAGHIDMISGYEYDGWKCWGDKGRIQKCDSNFTVQSCWVEFQRCKAEWKKDNGDYTHSAYRRIMSMGKMGIILMLDDLHKNGPTNWFYALNKLTGVNPAGKNDISHGRIKEITSAWIAWGRKKKYIPFYLANN